MARDFEGQRVFLTGASSGIGHALAVRIGAGGGRVALVARRLERLESVAAEVRAAGGEALVLPADVTDGAAIAEAARQTVAAWGGIDITIANAGFGVVGDVASMGIEDFRRQFETNIYGVLHTIYATLDELKRSSGKLAIMGSVAGRVAVPGSGVYSMSKFALRGFAQALRGELAGEGVKVILLSPGFIDSDFRRVDNHGQYHAQADDGVPPFVRMDTKTAAAQMAKAILRGRREAVFTWFGKIVVFIDRFFPWVLELVFASGKVRGRREPQAEATHDPGAPQSKG